MARQLPLLLATLVWGTAGCAAEVAAPAKLPAVEVGQAAVSDAAPGADAAPVTETPEGLVVAVFPTVGEWTTSKRPRSGSNRTPVAALPFSVDELPTAVLGALLDDKAARLASGGVEAAELRIEKQQSYDNYGYGYGYGGGYRSTYHTVAVTGFTSGTFKIGPREMPVGSSPLYLNCGQYEARQPLRVEGVKNVEGKTLYEVADGYWDGVQCKGFVTARSTVELSEIVPGQAWAFVQCDEAGCAGKRTLQVVFAQVRSVITQSGPVRTQSGQPAARVALALRRGTAESVIATQSSGGWKQTNLTVEVQQGVRDDAPIAVAYVAGE
jgi:hypothetical protein